MKQRPVSAAIGFLIFTLMPLSTFSSDCMASSLTDTLNYRDSHDSNQLESDAQDFLLRNIRLIQQKQNLELLQALQTQTESRRVVDASTSILPSALKTLVLNASPADVQMEANYLSSTQYLLTGSAANGALNDVYGAPTWVVPRENAMAILGFIESAGITGDSSYLSKAQVAADYLVRVQDLSDGAWYDQYNYANPVSLSKSPTQTAEVMIAFKKLGFDANRYASMKKGAQYLMSLQNPANKGGNDDGLIGGGKDASGNYSKYRWASDNSYAWLALNAAASWAVSANDSAFAAQCNAAAAKIISGIDNYLYISNTRDKDYGVWRRVIDDKHRTINPSFHEWINYAPQMLDIPAKGVGNVRVGEWIHKTFQKSDGSVVWNDGAQKSRKSPGYSFQAALVWYDLGQTAYADAAVNWSKNSGLWQKTPDANGISGGWIDWAEVGQAAQWWERFIDTSFYSIAAFEGGYNFRS